MAKRKYSKKGNRQAKPQTIDGIKVKSKLEAYMLQALKDAKLFEGYENETWELLPSLSSVNLCYERQGNGKGDFKQRNGSAVRKCTYTPDFTGKDFIIETKGYAQGDFKMKWKLFKHKLDDTKDARIIYKPHTKTECDLVIQIIKNNRN